MRRITVDAAMHQKLIEFPVPIEICDAEGNAIGQFIPDPSQFAWGSEPSLEELERGRNSDKRFTTEEVLARLRDRS